MSLLIIELQLLLYKISLNKRDKKDIINSNNNNNEN